MILAPARKNGQGPGSGAEDATAVAYRDARHDHKRGSLLRLSRDPGFVPVCRPAAIGFARTRQIPASRGRSHFLMRLRAGVLQAPLLGSIWADAQNKPAKNKR
jgi:hypothetical protein